MRQSSIGVGRSMAPHVPTLGPSVIVHLGMKVCILKRALCQKHFHLKEVSVSETKGNPKDAALLLFLSFLLGVLGQRCFLFHHKEGKRRAG